MCVKFRSWVIVGTLAAVSFTMGGCGSTPSPRAADDPSTSAGACAPPMDKWERNAEFAPAAERAATPEQAVSVVSIATSLQITSVIPGTDSQSADVEVLGDGVEGTYHLQKIEDQWLVVGGDGCGAQIAPTTSEEDCEFPSDIPTEAGETFLIECEDIEP